MQVVFSHHQFSFLSVQSILRVESVVFSVSWVTVYDVHGLPTIIQCRLCSVSVVFTCQWGSESIAFSVNSVSVAFTVQWVILRLYSSVSALFTVMAVHHESVMFMSCSESTLWMSSAPAQFLSFNILSTTGGHLRTKYNVKLLFFKSTYLSMHNDTRFGTYFFPAGTHRGNLPVSSRFSTGDLNFCVHSIPLCVEKRVMLRASIMHSPVGGAL